VFRPRLKDLVQMNTPRVVMQETKKAFRHIHKQNLEAAVAAMSNLKGVGPAMASGNSSLLRSTTSQRAQDEQVGGKTTAGAKLIYSVGTPTCPLVRCLCCGRRTESSELAV
jgi:hypothetical protein